MDAEPTAPDAHHPPRGYGATHAWRPDVLGGGFRSLDLPLPDDEQATLVAYDPASGAPRAAIDRDTWATLEDSMPRDLLDDVAILYLHGWSDYFYHAHLARFWSHMGADFYALDLRGYGRNLDPERVEKAHSPRPDDDEHVQRPGYITDLAEYDADLEAALAVIEETSPGRRIVVSGHSTGGLIAVLWADRNPGRLSGITLNSPWLEFQYSTTIRKVLQPFLGRGRSATTPLRLHMPNYSAVATSATHGRLPYDARLKPTDSFPVYAGWIRAIFAGHAAVEDGLEIDAPVLVQTSTKSLRKIGYDPEMEATDIVLDVDAIARRSIHLGRTVALNRIPGAMHDLFLSHPAAQVDAFSGLLRFARGFLTADVLPRGTSAAGTSTAAPTAGPRMRS
ncbi:MAG: alpha/beta hydrolase [Brevibacterium yomogidense]|uniref:alpha/beta hydrolase n=1 Tax=Brevibacterium sp. Mu109 TaxID=1255669 RepID=UPI000C4A8DD3|nr:alpha/beta hydrolase [Brevibacterium sp. Mu109]SMX65149.1 Lysophospholipase, alpha-beta hydrolase superfamily [Brevibacterium sp. Mu109]